MNKINIAVILHLFDTNGTKTHFRIKGDIDLKSTTMSLTGCFNQEKIINIAFADSNGDVPRSLDDVATINFSLKTTFDNERHIKKKIKDSISYTIEKRQNDIYFLEKDREEMNKKIVNIEASENDILKYYKKIELINEQIRQHYKEIVILKKNIPTTIEVGTQINKYEFQLEENHIQHISGLDGQYTQFSIFWFITKKDNTTQPTCVTMNNTKTLDISYDTL
jgi:hypothetical protein